MLVLSSKCIGTVPWVHIAHWQGVIQPWCEVLMASSASSSSWQVSQPASEAPAVPSATQADQDPTQTELWAELTRLGLALQPHDEHVKPYTSYADSRYTLVHALTLERVKLAPGIEWDIAYDDNGYGGVFDKKLLQGSMFDQVTA